MTTQTTPLVQTFHFRTIIDGEVQRPTTIQATSISKAVATLRRGLYEGETIVGWE